MYFHFLQNDLISFLEALYTDVKEQNIKEFISNRTEYFPI